MRAVELFFRIRYRLKCMVYWLPSTMNEWPRLSSKGQGIEMYFRRFISKWSLAIDNLIPCDAASNFVVRFGVTFNSIQKAYEKAYKMKVQAKRRKIMDNDHD